MKLIQFAAALSIGLAGSASAAGGHDHDHGKGHKPLHGGIVAEVKNVDYELVAKPESIELYLHNHGAPIAVAGGSAKATVLSGAEKQEVELKPAGDRFEYRGAVKAAKGAKVVVVVNLPGKPVATARFVLK